MKIAPPVSAKYGGGERIHESLEITEEGGQVRCIQCGYSFGRAGENYKEYAARKTVTPPQNGAVTP